MCGTRSRQDRQMRDDVVKTAKVSTVFAQTRAVAADGNVHNTEQVIALILWGDIGLARNMCKFQPHKPGPTQTPCAPPVRELWVACSATQELPTRPSYAPKTLEQKRKSVGTKKAVLEVLGQKKTLRWTRKSHIGTLLPRDVSLHDCRHIEIDA